MKTGESYTRFDVGFPWTTGSCINMCPISLVRHLLPSREHLILSWLGTAMRFQVQHISINQLERAHHVTGVANRRNIIIIAHHVRIMVNPHIFLKRSVWKVRCTHETRRNICILPITRYLILSVEPQTCCIDTGPGFGHHRTRRCP